MTAANIRFDRCLTLQLLVGRILPMEDEPEPPTTLAAFQPHESLFVPVEDAEFALRENDNLTHLFIADRSYIPLLARDDGPPVPIGWSGATPHFTECNKSLASFILNPQAQITVTADGQVRALLGHPVTAEPPLSVRGYNGQRVTFRVEGWTFRAGDTFRFEANSGITIPAGTVFTVNGDRITGTINTAATAQGGSRRVIFNVPNPANPTQRRDVAFPDAFTVYRGVIPSLLDHLDRPAFNPAQPNQRQPAPGVVGGNPRTQAQEDRITAVVNAADRPALGTAWNALISYPPANHSDVPMTVHRPSRVDQAQVDVLIRAATQIEANSSKLTIGQASDPQPPDVPLSMWEGFLRFIAMEESSSTPLAMAGGGENSYGLVQFSDVRANGNNFLGSTGQTIPIRRDGMGFTADWKAHFLAATTVAELRARVANLNDWRADPFLSLVNLIRSSQAYYGWLMIAPASAPTIYESDDDFRADLIPPLREHGQGSQRDCFELLAVAHRLSVDVFEGTFGGTDYEGGLLTAPKPNQWHTTGTAPSGKPFMTADGTARAQAARAYYDPNAPAGGYQ